MTAPVTLRDETKRLLGQVARADTEGRLFPVAKDYRGRRAYRRLLSLGFVAVNRSSDPEGLCLTPAGRQWWERHVDAVHARATA